MKLFLASEGSDIRTVKKLEGYINGFKGKTVAYIPTAKNGNGEGRWQESRTWQFLLASGMTPKAVELEKYLNGIEVKDFFDADLIWITGGAAGYLMYWIYRTGFDKILPQLLKKSIYVGSSAGAMITAPDLNVCDWYIGETERGASYLPGLGLTDFDFYPHYEDRLLSQIKSNYKGKKIYLVKNGEEIIVENGKVLLTGEERKITND